METRDQGCLLRKEPSGERNFLMVFFLRESGLINVLARKSSGPNSGTSLPDLYETGWLVLQRKDSGKFAFLKEFEQESGFPGIARDYQRLQAAAALSLFYERNLVHMETFDDAWDLLGQSLEALSTKPRPELILLKTLFVLARSEGYPVATAWLGRFPPDTALSVKSALKRPVEEVPQEPDTIHAWIRNLYAFFRSETDLLPPRD